MAITLTAKKNIVKGTSHPSPQPHFFSTCVEETGNQFLSDHQFVRATIRILLNP